MRKEPISRRCERKECGQPFVVDHRSPEQKYCSPACYHATLRKPAKPSNMTEAERIARAARLADGSATVEDQLRDENNELRQRLRTAETALNSYRSKTRVEDQLLRNIQEYIEKNPYRPQLVRPKLKVSGKASPHQMIALLSDAHFPEVIDPAAMFGIGYNNDICLRRLAHVRDTVIRYADLRATSYPTEKLTVAVNGDMLSGTIHEELEISNAFPETEAMVLMGQALFDMGCSLAANFPEVEFIVMPGNHPRLQKKPRAKAKWNNWEWVMGKYLAALAGGRFNVTVPKDLIYRHQVYDLTIGITHGDGVKVQSFAGIPFYSLERRRNALQSLLKSVGSPQVDMLLYGHFHTLIYEEGQGCGVVINGSIKGPDEYSVSSSYRGQMPVQALLTFHPRHGMTDLSRINLGHIQ